MYQKFMSAKDENSAKRAVVGMIVGVIVIETVLDATAIFGAGAHWSDPAFRTAQGALDGPATETIILQLATSNLPTLVGVLLLIGAAAIIFSTANTFLMVPSTNLTRDVYQRFLRPAASQREIIAFQRAMIVVLAGVAFLVTFRFQTILEMALYAYTMVGAAVTPALLAAFLWRRVTPAGGTASVAAGVVTTVVFAVLVQIEAVAELDFGLFVLPLDYDYIIYPAGIASILCLVVVSLLGKRSPEAKWRPFWASAAAPAAGAGPGRPGDA
jgi:SSS family solute:Na+ symporter/sodium/proline symporter